MDSSSRYSVGAFAVIVDSQDRVLVSHRRDVDLWNLPGGQVEARELPDSAVVREVKEETGLDVEVVRLVGVYGRDDEKADLVFSFACKVVGGELTTTSEADEHGWFYVDDLPLNTIPKQVARIRDTFVESPSTIFRTLSEPSGREWLKTLQERDIQQ